MSLQGSQDKHRAGTRICLLMVSHQPLFPSLQTYFRTDFRLYLLASCFKLYLFASFSQLQEEIFFTSRCILGIQLLKSSFSLKISSDSESTSVLWLTRLMRRLIAYSWVQMHSQGSKPPSAIFHLTESTFEWDKRLYATRTYMNKWEKPNAASCQCCALLVFHRYKQNKGRGLSTDSVAVLSCCNLRVKSEGCHNFLCLCLYFTMFVAFFFKNWK